jgi:hypothetical protein
VQEPRGRPHALLRNGQQRRLGKRGRALQQPFAILSAPHHRREALLHDPEREGLLELGRASVQHAHPVPCGTTARSVGQSGLADPRRTLDQQ